MVKDKKGIIVTSDYLKKDSLKCRFTVDVGYEHLLHTEELRMAEWIYSEFGGNIRVIKEKNEYRSKDPEYVWNGKFWELKTINSIKRIDDRVREGLKQISNNPGGIILNFKNYPKDINSIIKVIDKRMQRYKQKNSIDIMIVCRETLLEVIRYN